MGERIAKSSGKLYWFGTGSAPVAESDASGNLTNEYIFFNGKRVAMKRMSDATVHYYFADQIGSANVLTSADGSVVEQDIEYHPYGEQQVYTDTLGQEYRFTGKEHDPETNLDYFGARYYGSAFGRFLTPDWAATPVPIPYAVMGNPQTLNLYSYVENNPITGTDPDGHTDVNLNTGGAPKGDTDVAQDAAAEGKTGDSQVWDTIANTATRAINFAAGAVNAIASNNIGGLFRSDSKNSDFKTGQTIGDAVSVVQGAHEVVSGFKAAEGGLVLSAVPGGQAVGPATVTAGLGMIAHGTVTGISGFSHFMKDAQESSSTGGGRNEQKSNVDRVQSAKDKLSELTKQRDTLKSKPNKTPADKAELNRVNRAINRENSRMQKSETHSRKEKG